ncbi:hypothetical protein ACI784_07375 [Geodermatophilus sp. SYSU D01186]
MPTAEVVATRGKYDDPARNEDAVVVTEHFFAVVDGATAKHPVAGGESPGRRASQAVAAAIRGLPPTVGAREAVDVLTRALAALGTSSDVAELPSASVQLLSVHRDEIWAVGDGWASCDGEATRFGHEVERRGARARAALLRTQLERTGLAELLEHDPGRAMILPLLASEHLLTNLDRDDPLVFGRLDGRPVPDRLLRVISLPADWRRVVLASDGYPALGGTFEESEQLLAQRLREDPLMIADPPATKGVGPGQISFDDRTWLEVVR